jgi:hypothetical protein
MPSNDRTGSIVRITLILAAAVALFAMVAYYRKNHTPSERFSLTGGSSTHGQQQQQHMMMPSKDQRNGGGWVASSTTPSAVEPIGNEHFLPLPNTVGMGPKNPSEPFPQDRITPDQLLPKDASNSQWAQANPAGQGDVKDQNYLTAGYHIGFDTQGSSLRNASHDIRSSPPNPRYSVSIWQQSTIEPDLNRRPLE